MSLPLATAAAPVIDFTANERFRLRYARELAAYARSLEADAPHLVVAIARKAPRLLQLIEAAPELPSPPLGLCVTEKALPFMPREFLQGRSVVLTDDTVIYGATLFRIRQELLEAGMDVSTSVLALSTKANPAVAHLVDNAAIRMPESDLRVFIDREILAFGALGIPYDIDHTILTASLAHPRQVAAGRYLNTKSDALEVTQSWQRENGVRVITAPIPDSVLSRHSQRRRQLGPRKLRFFIDGNSGQVRFATIFCLALSNADLTSRDLFRAAPAEISGVWEHLCDAASAGVSDGATKARALASAAHYLASAEAASLWLLRDSQSLIAGEATVNAFDVQLLFGDTAAPFVTRPLQDLLGSVYGGRVLGTADAAEPGVKLDAAAEVEALRATPRGARLNKALADHLQHVPHNDPNELADAIFNAQRLFYDMANEDSEDLAGVRLSQSLIPFVAIPALLAAHCAAVSKSDFDRWCDIAIDAGSIVPYYHESASVPGLWVRCVRAGENRMQHLRYWTHAAITQIVAGVKPAPQGTATASWYVTEKALAALAGALQSEVRLALHRRVDVGFDEFGARAVLPELPHGPYLVDWAMSAGVAQRLSGRITPSPTFDTRFPPNANNVPRAFRLATTAILKAFMAIESGLRGPDRADALLALSTCGDYERYVRALSTELSVWLHGRNGVSALVSDLIEFAASPEAGRAPIRIREGVAASAKTLRQGAVKERAYRRRVEIRDMLDEKFARDARFSPHAGGWEEYLRFRIDDEEPANDRSARQLRWAIEVARRTLSVVRAVLGEQGVAPLAPEDVERHTVARHFALLEEQLIRGREEFRYDELPVPDEAALKHDDMETALTSGGLLLEAIAAVAEDVWLIWHRSEGRDPLQPIPDDRTILLWDIRDSSKAQDNHALTTAIYRANERVRGVISRSGGLEFHESQDDGNGVIVPTVAGAIRIFHEVSQAYEDEGFFVRAGAGTTVGATKLELNRDTGHYGGRPYQITARLRDAFKEVAISATGSSHPLPPDATSYLNLSRDSAEVLRREGLEEPPGLQLNQTIADFEPRVASTLSTTVYCYIPTPPSPPRPLDNTLFDPDVDFD